MEDIDILLTWYPIERKIHTVGHQMPSGWWHVYTPFDKEWHYVPESDVKIIGRQVYLTNDEIKALRDTCTEWCEMMSDGSNDEYVKSVEERMKNGLGSALYKLYKGCNGAKAYEKFVKVRRKIKRTKYSK